MPVVLAAMAPNRSGMMAHLNYGDNVFAFFLQYLTI